MTSVPVVSADFPAATAERHLQPIFRPPMKTVLLAASLLVLVPRLPAAVSFFGYLTQTAVQGEAESEFILSLTLRDGWDGTVRVGSAAARWCELAAESDDQRPPLLLGLLQQDPVRVAADRPRALALLGQAAAQGDDYAQVMLGEMMLEGDGVPADWARGAALIRQAADAGFPPAELRLGLIYLVGGESTPKNEIESLAWFIVAAEAGSKTAREYRDERTALLGRDAARLAVIRSRTLLAGRTIRARVTATQTQAGLSGSR